MAESPLSAIDWRTIRTSALAGLMVIVPAALLSELVVGDEGGRPLLGFLFVAVIVIGFVIAGFGAGRLRNDTPIMHGVVAAISCYAVVQILGLIKRLVVGDDINIASYVVSAILAGFCGASGALFAERMQRQASTS